MIQAFVTGQKLTLPRAFVVADTIDYLEVAFNFQTADWTGRSVWAFFQQSGEPYKINLHDGKVLKGDHLNLAEGRWTVWLMGTAPDGSRITTNQAEMTVEKTGPMNGEPLGEIPLSPAEQIDQKAQQALDGVHDLDGRVTELEENGGGGGTGGTSDYNKLTNKPSINGHELRAGMTSQELGIKDGKDGAPYTHSEEFSQLAEQVRADAGFAKASQEAAAGSAAAASTSAGQAAASEKTAQQAATNAASSAEQAQTDALTATGAAKSAQTEAGKAKSEADRSAEAAALSVSHGITGAKIGDLMQITAVDESGVPTALTPTTLEELEGKWELIETIEPKVSAVLNRENEPDGTPYKFKAIKITIFSLTAERMSGILTIDSDGHNKLLNYRVELADHDEATIIFYRMFGNWSSTMETFNKTNAGFNSTKYQSSITQNDEKPNQFTEIKYIGGTFKYNPGCKIVIKAVRA